MGHVDGPVRAALRAGGVEPTWNGAVAHLGRRGWRFSTEAWRRGTDAYRVVITDAAGVEVGAGSGRNPDAALLAAPAAALGGA